MAKEFEDISGPLEAEMKQREEQNRLLLQNAKRIRGNFSAFDLSHHQYNSLHPLAESLDPVLRGEILMAEDHAQLITGTFKKIVIDFPEHVGTLFIGYQGVFNRSFYTQEPPVNTYLD